MRIKWLGHASFLITSESGIKIITDPYTPKETLTYSEIQEPADIVTVSHEHGDHNNTAAVQGNPDVIRGTGTQDVKGVKIKGVSCFHDDSGGEKRGKNTIFCLEVDGIRVCHLGDLGHRLSAAQESELGKVDILLLPVGGFYTIDDKVATELARDIEPAVAIPMHFCNEKCSFPIRGVDEFLKGKQDMSQPDTSEMEFKAGQLPDHTQVVVLKPAK
jgi:L-ascorbate metabolism protein UlaG (beta-lactamase superfamily)